MKLVCCEYNTLTGGLGLRVATFPSRLLLQKIRPHFQMQVCPLLNARYKMVPMSNWCVPVLLDNCGTNYQTETAALSLQVGTLHIYLSLELPVIRD
jgi:hypothetical protein